MYDAELALEILKQILTAALRIERRFAGIQSPSAFLSTDEGIDRLDGVAMMLIVIGEGVKNLDKVTGKTLLPKYPDVDWKSVKGMRDVISHHYVDMNAEVVFKICKDEIPTLIKTVGKMLTEIGRGPAV